MNTFYEYIILIIFISVTTYNYQFNPNLNSNIFFNTGNLNKLILNFLYNFIKKN